MMQQNLIHLVNKSNKRLEEQDITFRNNQTKATTLIGAILIFLPLFFDFVINVKFAVFILSVITIIVLLIALTLMIQVIYPKLVPYGYKNEKYFELIKKKYDENLQYELGLNLKVIDKKDKVISTQNNRLKIGIIFIGIGIFLTFFSAILESILNS